MYTSSGLKAMLSLCYRNNRAMNIYYQTDMRTSRWSQLYLYCTWHVFEIGLNIYVPRARKKVPPHCPRLVEFPSAQVPFHCQWPDVKGIRQVVCHLTHYKRTRLARGNKIWKGKLKFTFLLEPWFDSTIAQRLKSKVMKGCNLLQ